MRRGTDGGPRKPWRARDVSVRMAVLAVTAILVLAWVSTSMATLFSTGSHKVPTVPTSTSEVVVTASPTPTFEIPQYTGPASPTEVATATATPDAREETGPYTAACTEYADRYERVRDPENNFTQEELKVYYDEMVEACTP